MRRTGTNLGAPAVVAIAAATVADAAALGLLAAAPEPDPLALLAGSVALVASIVAVILTTYAGRRAARADRPARPPSGEFIR